MAFGLSFEPILEVLGETFLDDSVTDFSISFKLFFLLFKLILSLTRGGKQLTWGWSRGVYDRYFKSRSTLIYFENCFSMCICLTSRLRFIVSISLTFSRFWARFSRASEIATTSRSWRTRLASSNSFYRRSCSAHISCFWLFLFWLDYVLPPREG